MVTSSLLLLLCGYVAGLLGALLGLGGGIVIVPILVMFFDVDIHNAMAISLLAAIATSAAASLRLSREKYTNIRLAMFLEVGTVVGAVIGAYVAHKISTGVISILFGCVLLFSVWFSLNKFAKHTRHPDSHRWVGKFKLAQDKDYKIYNVPTACGLMGIAGLLSGLLGIGSGTFKVLVFDLVMGLPYKVATATSNFMIGMTVAAGAGVYFAAGYVQPELCFPIIPGVLLGALAGARLLIVSNSRHVKILFNIVITILAIKMIYSGAMHYV